MTRLEDIMEKVVSYNPSANLDVIRKAYVFSAKVHEGQTRLSGGPYMSHPLQVASILADLKMDAAVIAVGLLHDTIEDSHTSLEKIEELFGREVSTLVDGLTKISNITFEKKEDREAENFRKFILAMAKDIRVILIKLADRLHNMRTLEALPLEKQRSIARETLDIYAPLANRLGIGWIKTELEDLAFKHLDPEKYRWVEEALKKEKEDKGGYIAEVSGVIEAKLAEQGIKCEVSGRTKHLYSVYKKMRQDDIDFESIYDLLAFRIVVDSVKDCYGALGVIHSAWRPVPDRFKDFIAIPKPNFYQALHTTVIGPYGKRMEVQIRTHEMHKVAEYGIAAHWRYKEGKLIDEKGTRPFAWIRQLLEWQKELTDSYEFLETIKVDLFSEEVFVFTPKGALKVLPIGATPVDLAYAVHTDIGNSCTGAKVNGKMVPLKHTLRNGDVVEIITSANHVPSKDWLKFVVTSRARARIRQWIKAEEREKCLTLGREIIEKALKKYDIEFGKLLKSGEFEKAAKEHFGLQNGESLILNVGYGKISLQQVVSKLVPKERFKKPSGVAAIMKVLDKFKTRPKDKPSASRGIIISGVEDMMVKFARCCEPLPGDGIVGFITHGQGITIHAKVCQNIAGVDRERFVDVEWDKKSTETRPVKIEVVCKDEKGLLADMGNAIKNADANISSADIKTTEDAKAICTFEVEVRDKEHLKNIIRSLEKIKKVMKIERIRSEQFPSGGSKIFRQV